MKKVRKLLIIIMMICFTSCVFDPPRSHISIVNSSRNAIKSVVYYNRDYISYRYGTDTCISCIIKNSTSNYYNCISCLSFDTSNLTGTYNIDSNCKFNLSLSLSREPSFEYDSIRIITAIDTIKISGNTDNLKFFKEHKWQVFELKIK
jgi:hypothetical protein